MWWNCIIKLNLGSLWDAQQKVPSSPESDWQGSVTCCKCNKWFNQQSWQCTCQGRRDHWLPRWSGAKIAIIKKKGEYNYLYIYIYLFLIYNIPRQFVNLCFIIVINDYFLVFLSCKTTSKQQQLKMHMYVCTFYIIQGEHLILHEKV